MSEERGVTLGEVEIVAGLLRCMVSDAICEVAARKFSEAYLTGKKIEEQERDE